MIRCSTAILCASVLLMGTPQVGMSAPSEDQASPATVQPVKIIPATDALIENAARGGNAIRLLVEAAKPTIGVPYEWGGSNLLAGVDCSGYTWQLCSKVGFPYELYLDTKALAQVRESNGLRRISFEEAQAGDLLVYGYHDETNHWRGHVVILVDKDGRNTGHKGLVLGAHGPPVDAVQFITFTGFDEGFYKTPEKRLRNVLRMEGSHGTHQAAPPSTDGTTDQR